MLTEQATNVTATTPTRRRSRLERAMRAEWLGQMAASVFWVTSVFVYGISSTGDWLQLAAASAWMVANLAALAIEEGEGP